MVTQRQFERYLQERRFEPARPGLAERIIAATGERKFVGYSATGIIAYFAGVIESLLPKPAYILAIVLIIGILIGASLPMQSNEAEFALTPDEQEIL